MMRFLFVKPISDIDVYIAMACDSWSPEDTLPIVVVEDGICPTPNLAVWLFDTLCSFEWESTRWCYFVVLLNGLLTEESSFLILCLVISILEFGDSGGIPTKILGSPPPPPPLALDPENKLARLGIFWEEVSISCFSFEFCMTTLLMWLDLSPFGVMLLTIAFEGGKTGYLLSLRALFWSTYGWV